MIRINEVPQINERKIKINQARGGVPVTDAAGVAGLVGCIGVLMGVSMGIYF